MDEYILNQIVAKKYECLAQLKENYPLQGQRKHPKISVETLIDTLIQKRIITELKRSSPSMGPIDMNVDYIQRAKDYEAGGAGMLSILTDEPYFSGSFTFLEEIGQQVDCPILCKDFIIDKWQLDAAEFAGADAVLLIVSCFEQAKEKLSELYFYALEKGLVPLVEIYSPEERYEAYALKPYLLGVNSRNLKNMQIDLEQGASTLALLRNELSMPQAKTVRMHSGLPDMPLFVGESGIFEPKDAQTWVNGGADCLLIGTSLMLTGRNDNSKKTVDKQLSNQISQFYNVFN